MRCLKAFTTWKKSHLCARSVLMPCCLPKAHQILFFSFNHMSLLNILLNNCSDVWSNANYYYELILRLITIFQFLNILMIKTLKKYLIELRNFLLYVKQFTYQYWRESFKKWSNNIKINVLRSLSSSLEYKWLIGENLWFSRDSIAYETQ